MPMRQETEPTRRRSSGRHDNHVAILKAASELFGRQGFSATSMDEIALKAGVARQTIYNHFSGKDQVFQALAEYFADLVTASLPEFADGSDLSSSLIDLARRIRSQLLAPTSIALHRVLIWEAPHFPELAKAVYAAGPHRLISQLATQLAAKSSRRLSPAEAMHAAEQFVGMILGRSQLRALLGVGEPTGAHAAARVEQTVEAFLKGWDLG